MGEAVLGEACLCSSQGRVGESTTLLVRAPGPLTSGAQVHAVASAIPRLPSGPVSKIPATPISPAKSPATGLEKREAGSEGRGPARQMLGLLKVL